jgi:cyclopropane fatty-acyl-phospholipid synthase-like methyltransferase
MEGSRRAEERSAQFWERFAQNDPYTYILTSLQEPDPQKFWQSGEATVNQELLPLIQARRLTPGIGLELGCGVGRLVFPLAQHFREVLGLDISEGMIRRSLTFARANNIHNTTFTVISGPQDLLHKLGSYAGKIDFLFSLLVFQHVSDLSMIKGYLHVIGILLGKNGTAYLQFDTRQQDYLYHIKSTLPDFLLPRFWRRGIRRIRRSTEEIESAFRCAGLEIIGEWAPRTHYHRYLIRRMPSSLAAK